MRFARSNDIWRELYRDDTFPFVELTIKYRDVVGLGSGEAKFSHPMSIICGENGVGKTTLLRLINRALNQGRDESELNVSTYAKGALTGTIEACTIVLREGSEKRSISQEEIAAKNRDDPDWLDVSFVETVSVVPHLQKLYAADANRGDLLEGVTARILAGTDLDTVRQLVGRDYEQVEIFEIAEYAGFARVPYFRITEGNVTYGSESTGTGELALLHLFWEISSSSDRSILLLEEPESFVAPRSQRIFIDWLALLAAEKKLFVIAASHSGQIADRFPSQPTILCTRSAGRVIVEHGPARHVLADRLGILSHRRTVVLAEDEAAIALATCLLMDLDATVVVECEFVKAGSNGEIVSALKSFPQFDSERFCLIGVFDGDQAEQRLPWPSLRLPGTQGPEHLLKQVCSGASSELVAKALGVTVDRWEAAKGGAAGMDKHEWLKHLSKELRLPIDTLFSRLAPAIIEFAQGECKKFVAEFGTKVRRR
jgi:hypothetical protein